MCVYPAAMDSMMFSPYGYGPLPPSAMAEIERKTAAALQSNDSLRKLLELDKEPKVRCVAALLLALTAPAACCQGCRPMFAGCLTPRHV